MSASSSTQIRADSNPNSSMMGSSSSKIDNNVPSSGKVMSSTVSPAVNSSTAADTATAEKVKPCCVCKDEKAARDECMLFTQSDDPQRACRDLVGRYKDCMAGFGFQIG